VYFTRVLVNVFVITAGSAPKAIINGSRGARRIPGRTRNVLVLVRGTVASRRQVQKVIQP
jgi:hypothetical protein